MIDLMFDTNIFNAIVDGGIDIAPFLAKANIYITHIQQDELSATKNQERRSQLLSAFHAVIKDRIPTESTVLGTSRLGESKLGGGKVETESFVWDTSNWDEAKWSANDQLYNQLKNALDQKNKGKANNVKDALIAETAILRKFILVTHDADLYSVVTKCNGAACNLRLVSTLIELSDKGS